jgi:hydroxyacylglutathione hydrolase
MPPSLALQLIPVTHFMQNCSLVWCRDSGAGVLIDPGGDLPRLQAAVSAAGVTITAIWLTHGHLDHVGGAAAAAAAFDVGIIGPHADDRFLFEALDQQAEMFGFAPITPFLPDRWLSAGDQLSLGKVHFSVRHAPGHTPGHIALVAESEAQVWVGDLLFAGSIGRSDLPRGHGATLLRSIRSQLLTLPDHFTVIPGHGRTTTIGEERRSNPFLR